jgi:hypothetical protein
LMWPAKGGNHAIKAFVNGTVGPGNASITYNGPGLSSSGTNSTVIQAQSDFGNASIDASGNMSGHVTSTQSSENTFVGLFAVGGGDGNASVIYRNGTINVQGRASNGIFDPLSVPATPTQSVTAGISAELSSGTAALGRAITVNASQAAGRCGSPMSGATSGKAGGRSST